MRHTDNFETNPSGRNLFEYMISFDFHETGLFIQQLLLPMTVSIEQNTTLHDHSWQFPIEENLS